MQRVHVGSVACLLAFLLACLPTSMLSLQFACLSPFLLAILPSWRVLVCALARRVGDMLQTRAGRAQRDDPPRAAGRTLAGRCPAPHCRHVVRCSRIGGGPPEASAWSAAASSSVGMRGPTAVVGATGRSPHLFRCAARCMLLVVVALGLGWGSKRSVTGARKAIRLGARIGRDVGFARLRGMAATTPCFR